jgi:uncharacterized membrane protein
MRERLHREPYFAHPRLKFIPNIVVNLISFLLSFAVVASVVYFILNYLITKFYHLD